MKAIYTLLTITLTTLWIVSCRESNMTKEGNNRNSRTFPVRAVVLHPSIFQRDFSSTGTFEANEQVMVASEIAGRIEKIHFEEGDYVLEGQLLVSINADDIKAERRQI